LFLSNISVLEIPVLLNFLLNKYSITIFYIVLINHILY
jgi:hypothetical protein